jgi:allantoate deiminase
MALRFDALGAAAEFVLAVEERAHRTKGLVATVGQMHLQPNVSNVIPSQAVLMLDVRHREDSVRQESCGALRKTALQIALARRLKVSWVAIQEIPSVSCDTTLSALLKRAVKNHQRVALELPSGTGHDAAVMSQITPVSMLFVRCRNGLSHHPDESVTTEDIRSALAVMKDFLQSFAEANA